MQLTLEKPERLAEAESIRTACDKAVACSDLLECLSPKQQYDRAYYLKNRDKKLARARAQNKYPKSITKKCVVCGNDFECGGPNPKRSPKAFTCGDTCQSKYRHRKNAEYIKANYERVRAIDNEAHRKKRADQTFKEREYEKNRARMRNYRKDPAWRAKENTKNKIYNREYRKTERWRKYQAAYRPKARGNVARHRARSVGAIRLMQMLAVAKSVTPK